MSCFRRLAAGSLCQQLLFVALAHEVGEIKNSRCFTGGKKVNSLDGAVDNYLLTYRYGFGGWMN